MGRVLPEPFKSLWQLLALPANALNLDPLIQLAVTGSNVSLLGFILAFEDFCVDSDGVRKIAREFFVWPLVSSALSGQQDSKSYSFRRQGFYLCSLLALPSSLPSVIPFSQPDFMAQSMMLKSPVERVCLVKANVENSPSQSYLKK